MSTELERQVSQALATLVPDDGSRPDMLEAVRSRVRSRRRRRVAGAGLASVAVVAVTATGVLLPDVGAHRQPPRRLTSASGPIVRDGDLVSASGRVVAIPGRHVRFCTPAIAYALIEPPPAPAYCDLGVDVTGVDLGALSRRREQGGAIEGYARLIGTYRAGTVRVTRQEALADERPSDPPSDSVPCAAPAGGWPRGPHWENLDTSAVSAYQALHPDDIVTVALFRPSVAQVVLTIAAQDPQRVSTTLRPAYGARLCVVAARYSAAEVGTAMDALSAFTRGSRLGIWSVGQGVGADGQPHIEANVVMLTEKLVELERRFPAGLVQMKPWLAVVST